MFGTVIGIQIADGELARSAEQAQTRRGEHHRELADGILRTVGRAATGETLYRAIDAYIAWLEAKFVTPPEQGEEQRTSQTGKKQGERAARLKAHHKDIPLSDLTEKELDAMIAYWAARPKTEKAECTRSSRASTKSG